MLTLVEVGERFVVQFNGWRGSCTQNVLEGKDLVVIVWRQVGLLLLENGEGKYIAREHKKKQLLLVSSQHLSHVLLAHPHYFPFIKRFYKKLAVITFILRTKTVGKTP